MILELPAVIPSGEALPKRPTPWVLFYALRTQQIHLRELWCIKKARFYRAFLVARGGIEPPTSGL